MDNRAQLPQVLLVANRGEIACRIMRTARRLGIITVAVFTPEDANSQHRRAADFAIPITNYLQSKEIVESFVKLCDADIARSRFADKEKEPTNLAPAHDRGEQPQTCAAASSPPMTAVHPGVGFLSESGDFARVCRRAGWIFVGPSEAALRRAADKAAARRLATELGIAVVPGFDEAGADNAALAAAAERIGYPVLIKAAAGGGGRGMRVVTAGGEFGAALAAARREAAAAFGDNSVILEKYIGRARHLEAQIVADESGAVAVLGDRDCSLQRRHQKVIEEAPAPELTAATRRQMHEMTRRLAAAVGYAGAGTAEFLYDCDSGALYFLEINARLQVEHPVTEMVYGCDLVEMQLRIAMGATLADIGATALTARGCSVEARVCAEDPLRDFLPGGGMLRWNNSKGSKLGGCFSSPSGEVVRIDGGYGDGDWVSERYDSLLAKVVVWGETRGEAMGRLAAVLGGLDIGGVAHNVDFLRYLLEMPEVAAAEMTTGLIAARRGEWLAALTARRAEGVARAAAAVLAAAGALGGWRLMDDAQTVLDWADDSGRQWMLRARRRDGRIEVSAVGDLGDSSTERNESTHLSPAAAGDEAAGETFVFSEEELRKYPPAHDRCRLPRSRAAASKPGIMRGGMVAPMNAVVSSVAVEVGARVGVGDLLLTLEAMKMEMPVYADVSGVVKAVFFGVGARVAAGAALVEIGGGGDE